MVRSFSKVLILAALALPGWGLAQPTGADMSLVGKFQKHDFFYMLYSEHVKIELVKKKVVTTTHVDKIFCFNKYINTGYSSFDIVYNSAFSDIKNLEAASYIPLNGKYKKREVEEFTRSAYAESEVFQDSYRQIDFNLPGVQDGTIGQVTYDEVGTEPHFSNAFYFRHYAPIARSEFIVEVGDGIEIGFKYIGDSTDIKFERIVKGKTVTYRWVDLTQKIIKREDYMPELVKVSPGVVCWIKNYTVDGKKELVNQDLKSFTRWIYGVARHIYETPLSQEAIHIVDSIKGLNPVLADAGRSIYKWVQKNIKYIAFEDGMHGYVPRKPADVCFKRYGDCKDKATLLAAMLRHAGFESRTALIGTNSIQHKFSEVPIPECANHMVTAVKWNGKWTITDATDEYARFLQPVEALQGKEGLVLLDSTSYEIVVVPDAPWWANGRVDSLEIRIEDGKVIGKGKTWFMGFMKENVSEALDNTRADRLNEFHRALLDIGNNKTEYENVKHTDVNDTSILFTYDLNSPSYLTKFENKIYLNLHMFKAGMSDYGIDTSRVHPINFRYRSFKSHYVLVDLQGMSLSVIPKDVLHDHPKYFFEVRYKVSDKQLTFSTRISENTRSVRPVDFKEYEEFYNDYRHAILDNAAFTLK